MSAASHFQTQADRNPVFHFENAGSNSAGAWIRYKLKECWTLVLCLIALRRCKGAQIVHNWWGGESEKFTREFRDRRALSVDPKLAKAPILLAHDQSVLLRALALTVALALTFLPVAAIVVLARGFLPRHLGPLVVYCDAHLSGFVLVLAARDRGEMSYTLHHGLYRGDDRGSIMGLRNFVSDRICLWDDFTLEAFARTGSSPERLLKVGEYGFGKLSSKGACKDGLVLMAPPYDAAQLALFRQLETVLPDGTQTLWSLHPILRSDHPELPQATIAMTDPKPSVAICGDSGAIMDALSREVPILTVAERPLGRAHLSHLAASTIGPGQLAVLLTIARDGLNDDRMRFGFDVNKVDGQ